MKQWLPTIRGRERVRVIVVSSLKYPRPDDCDLYVAVTRTMPRPVPGWKWSQEIRELGPPLDLHRRQLAWSATGEWPGRWDEFQPDYLRCMEEEPCARLLGMLQRRIEAGEVVALGCWCAPPVYCHAFLLGVELAQRCGLAVQVCWEPSLTAQ